MHVCKQNMSNGSELFGGLYKLTSGEAPVSPAVALRLAIFTHHRSLSLWVFSYAVETFSFLQKISQERGLSGLSQRHAHLSSGQKW
jgi:hypothetical protein